MGGDQLQGGGAAGWGPRETEAALARRGSRGAGPPPRPPAPGDRPGSP
jgi:hypothetical protein